MDAVLDSNVLSSDDEISSSAGIVAVPVCAPIIRAKLSSNLVPRSSSSNRGLS